MAVGAQVAALNLAIAEGIAGDAAKDRAACARALEVR